LARLRPVAGAENKAYDQTVSGYGWSLRFQSMTEQELQRILREEPRLVGKA